MTLEQFVTSKYVKENQKNNGLYVERKHNGKYTSYFFRENSPEEYLCFESEYDTYGTWDNIKDFIECQFDSVFYIPDFQEKLSKLGISVNENSSMKDFTLEQLSLMLKECWNKDIIESFENLKESESITILSSNYGDEFYHGTNLCNVYERCLLDGNENRVLLCLDDVVNAIVADNDKLIIAGVWDYILEFEHEEVMRRLLKDFRILKFSKAILNELKKCESNFLNNQTHLPKSEIEQKILNRNEYFPDIYEFDKFLSDINNWLKNGDSKYWFVDGNYWSKSKYTKEQAEQLAETLDYCNDCIDCSDCRDCTNCIDCLDCANCANCSNCNNSRDCFVEN